MRLDVLDHGFVELIDRMGDDYRILQSARVSTGGEAKKGDESDRGLIRYLFRNQHLTPFEQVTLTFHVKAPIFVVRQWFRHRAASYNEISARYSELPGEYYIPEEWRLQGVKNHQGSGDAVPAGELAEELDFKYDEALKVADDTYRNALRKGVSREMARFVMPVAQYTEFYETINLRNLFHFLELRLHEHAQLETRAYADAIYRILKTIDGLKWTLEIFDETLRVDFAIQELKNAYKLDFGTLERKLREITPP
jgi:thymidylate synthase (FAD)